MLVFFSQAAETLPLAPCSRGYQEQARSIEIYNHKWLPFMVGRGGLGNMNVELKEENGFIGFNGVPPTRRVLARGGC